MGSVVDWLDGSYLFKQTNQNTNQPENQ